MTDLIKATGFNLPNLFDAHGMSKLFEEFDRNLFDSRSGYPYDIVLLEDRTTILKYALAGFTKEDIKVNVTGDSLNIEATTDAKDDESNIRYLHKGIAERTLKVSWKLGPLVDKHSIKSSFEDGMLRIEIPVKEEELVDIKVN